MSSSPPALNIESIYADNHRWLKTWIQRRLGNEFDAADLAHDTFVRLMTARIQCAAAQEPRALLIKIAKGLVVDHWRRQEVERAYLEAIAHRPMPFAPSPQEHLMVVETLVRIDALLAELPQHTREVFLLAQLDGLTLQQIVQKTGMTLITVRRHIQKALLNCMVALEEDNC